MIDFFFFFFQAEDGIRDLTVTGVQTCALPIFLVVPGERDLARAGQVEVVAFEVVDLVGVGAEEAGAGQDRKSTRLNSSHSQISYAVFCLKKKKKKNKKKTSTKNKE